MALASGPAAAVLGAPQPLLVNQDWSVAVGRAVLGALGADVPPCSNRSRGGSPVGDGWGAHWPRDLPWCLAPVAAAKSCQSYPTLCDPIGGSPPGSSIPGILQAGILEWVVISFSSA